ncbi:hypothetical protein BRYFOR_05599 [Marvinbryantia formatexigens DSM 14469]|uniref:Uncharacterized protein n=1 Tax=Marvinbryantia formatexigens DSM 14469 TaxID=478749 RepID=C6LAF7_9FIRM|nr:hypothetical protein BRYFOR_05599 [Marvinbryantia formatexigens DSM 14469]
MQIIFQVSCGREECEKDFITGTKSRELFGIQNAESRLDNAALQSVY